MSKQPSVLYLINSFSSGGAERGILSLIDTGFFNDTNLKLVAIHKGTGNLYDQLIEKIGHENVHYCTPHENLSPSAMLKALWYVFRTLFTGKFSHLMLSLTQSNLIGCVAAMCFPRLHVISFLHSTKVSKPIYKTLLKLTTWRVTSYLFDTEKTHAAAADSYSTRAKTWLYVPLVCVNTNTTKTDYKAHSPFSIFSAGRLSLPKNYTQAIHAIALLKTKGHAVHYFIAGDGEDKSQLEALISELNLQDEVTLLGHIDNWIEQAIEHDIFLLSSTHEGLSIVTVEAMSCSMPVVATNVGGITEYGVHLENMIKSDAPSAEHLTSAIESLLADDELRKTLGTQASADAFKEFSPAEIQKHIRHAHDILFK